jgi:type I restriction enzyme R subunit
MNIARYGETAFESVIENHLLSHGYVKITDKFDRTRALFPNIAIAFIQQTQPKEWKKLEALHKEKTGEQVLTDLCKWLDNYGLLHTLRHGFKCYGRTLRIAYFKAAHKLNSDLETRYAANCVGITRQLQYSEREKKRSLDITLSLNGIPVITLELKNPLTGQTVENAKQQYRQDRDPRETIFEFKRRTLVHFAVDTEEIWMTTRLAAEATHFLPFNKGYDGGAGNPPDTAGRNYRTAYLWEEVLQRDSLLDLLARFLHLQTEEKRDDDGRKFKKETMIFPRYHQLQAVRLLVAAARGEGVGQNYLIEHSAGSGKSNTIGWLTHRLASLYNEQNQRIFDSVIVISDRRVLDQQLQDTIYQFEHRQGVVEKIDDNSRQLAQALESAVPIIITTLQKFPFVTRQLIKLAEERNEESSGILPTRRFAVIIDEAHSSQSGETVTELKGVLGGQALQAEARNRAQEEGLEHLEELFRNLVKRSHQSNLSFFAFTATPKHETLKFFGRQGEPFHRYTMRQAIEEGFILDILRNYTTYKVYYNLIKATNNDHEKPEEAKVWRKKLTAFRNLYSFLSQIIPYQDSDLERLYIFLRYLSSKLPRRPQEAQYDFDSEVQLEYYRLQKISEGSIELRKSNAHPLDGPKDIGTGIARENTVKLSQLIDIINNRFGTDFNQADQLFFDQIVETAANYDELQQAARVNSADKFGLLFNQMLESLFVERVDQNEAIFARYMNDRDFQKVVADWLVGEVYKRIINSK